jgi:subfamily B ATP-binding cassette protein MsbA
MSDASKILRFALPYLRRYWLRFFLGIFFGFVFGLSNGLSVGGVYLMLNRLDDPAHVEKLAQEAREKKAQEKAYEESQKQAEAQSEAQQEKTQSGFTHQFHAGLRRIGQDFHATIDPWVDHFHATMKFVSGEIYATADPWLPLRGRPMDARQIVGGLLLIPILAFFRGMMSYTTTYLMAWSGQRIVNDVRADIFRKINTLSLDFFHRTTTAELLSRINDDAAAINTCLKLGLSDLVKEPSTIVILFAGLLLINWKLTLIALAFLPLCVIPTQRVARKIKQRGRQDNTELMRQSALAMESFQNVRVTKAYELGESHVRLFREAGERSGRFAMKTVQARAMLNPIVETLNGFGIGAVLLYTIWTGIPVSVLGTFIVALGLFYAPFKKLSGISIYFTTAGLAMERLMGLFNLQPSVRDPENPVPLPEFTRAIEFRHVGFSYGHGAVLDDVSFVLPRGRKLGLAGESGSGKSSLINLFFRFYDPTAGTIEIDGIPIDRVRMADLREHLALVSQDILLFDATVAENIGFGKAGATREEIIAAARAAYAHDFIEALPKGYDTPLGERGQRLSGGQRQRIAIARAFVRNAPILVLDEATASLDSQAEAEVQRAIDHLVENRTVICVAHRLSTLRAMDEILVLEKGRVIERGGFEELLSRRGAFTAMAARQSIYPQPVLV